MVLLPQHSSKKEEQQQQEGEGEEERKSRRVLGYFRRRGAHLLELKLPLNGWKRLRPKAGVFLELPTCTKNL